MIVPKLAKIKFNGGRGAILCEICDIIIREDFNPLDIEDKKYYCKKHEVNPPTNPRYLQTGRRSRWPHR